MSHQRTLRSVRTLPAPKQGQFGPDHRVVEVIRQDEWADADPFILLMDDRLDGHFQGGPHPHTGMETVTFLVNGDMGLENGSDGKLAPGDVEWTTTGKGVIHGRATDDEVHVRVLQLWVTLPKANRWAEPDHQFVPHATAPTRREDGAEVILYSGRSGDLKSPTRNHVPVTVAAITLQPGASIEQDAPRSHNGFFYVLEGTGEVGGKSLTVGQVGWLDTPEVTSGDAVIRVANTSSAPLRVLFYSGERQNIPLVTYGPFVGDTPDDIQRAFRDYRAGGFRAY